MKVNSIDVDFGGTADIYGNQIINKQAIPDG
jgi:hypothetical protein